MDAKSPTAPSEHAVVVTGVSTGIGHAVARHLGRHGYTVFGSVRAAGHAVALQRELGSRFIPLVFDVTDPDGVASAAELVAERLGGCGLRGLVNNAGIAVAGPLMHLPIEQIRRQFDVNVLGALAVTQRFLPLLGAQRDPPFPPGRIVNISSVGVATVFPFSAPYAASKHALEALSHGLRRELQLYGIDVIVVAPGVVATPIWDKQTAGIHHFAETDYALPLAKARMLTDRVAEEGMPEERVAVAVRRALETRRPRVRYAVPLRRVSLRSLIPWIPARRLDRILARRLELRPRTGHDNRPTD